MSTMTPLPVPRFTFEDDPGVMTKVPRLLSRLTMDASESRALDAAHDDRLETPSRANGPRIVRRDFGSAREGAHLPKSGATIDMEATRRSELVPNPSTSARAGR